MGRRLGWPLVISRRLFLVAAVVAIVVLAATASAGRVVIRGSGNDWLPERVRIERGTRVVWRATSGTHDVDAYGGNWTFSSHDISPSGDPTVAKVFRRTGTFRFRCTFHSQLQLGVCSGMCGRVRVTA
jgi:plastocyanin